MASGYSTSYNTGNVVNPFTNLASSLGDLSKTLADKDKVEADKAYRDQQLLLQQAAEQRAIDNQKMTQQEHQMKLDEVNNTKKSIALLADPQLSTAASITDSVNRTPQFANTIKANELTPDELAYISNGKVSVLGPDNQPLWKDNAPVLQDVTADMKKDILARNPDIEKSIAAKTLLQNGLSDTANKMAANDGYYESRSEQLNRVAREMGDNAPLSLLKSIDDQRLADRKEKESKRTELNKDSREADTNTMKLLLDTAGKYNKSGDSTGTASITKQYDILTKDKDDYENSYNKAIADLGKEVMSPAKGSIFAGLDETQRRAASEALLTQMTKAKSMGYDPDQVKNAVLASIKVEPGKGLNPFTWLNTAGASTLPLSDATINSLEAGKKTREALQLNKLTTLAGLTGTGSSGDAYRKELQNTVLPIIKAGKTKAEAGLAALDMTPSERVGAKVNSSLSKLLGVGATPVTEEDKGIPGDPSIISSSTGKYYTGYKQTKDYNDIPPKGHRTAINAAPTDVTKQINIMPEDVKNSPNAAVLAIEAIAESSGNATDTKSDGGTSGGLFSWHGDRRAEVVNWVNNKNNTNYKNIGEVPAADQYAFANFDITNGDRKYIGDAMAKVGTLEEKTKIFTDAYEKPAYGNHEATIRGKFAKQYGDAIGYKPVATKTEPSTEKPLSSLEITAEGDPYNIKTIAAKQELEQIEKNKKSVSETLLSKPIREWSDSDLKAASNLPDIPKDKRNYDLIDMLSPKTPMVQDPAKTRALKILQSNKADKGAIASVSEEGLDSSNLDWLPAGKVLGKVVEPVGNTVQLGLSKVPLVGRVIKSPIADDVVAVPKKLTAAAKKKLAVQADKAAKAAKLKKENDLIDSLMGIN